MSASPAQGTLDAAGPRAGARRRRAASPPGRLARMRAAAAARGIPLRTIIATVAVVVLTYLARQGPLPAAGRHPPDRVVAGFIALLLNPLVVYVQRCMVRRRGFAVAIVTVMARLVFAGPGRWRSGTRW